LFGLIKTLPSFFIFNHEKDFSLVNLKHVLQLAVRLQAYQGKLCSALVSLLDIEQPTSHSNEQNITPLTKQLPVL